MQPGVSGWLAAAGYGWCPHAEDGGKTSGLLVVG
jgi:hypothetical protein